jgi:hypothetical protein
LVGVTEKTVVHAFRRLKFTIVKKSHLKFVRMEPAVWAPPYEWPSLFQKQRELHRSGVSTGQVMSATDLSAELEAIINDAVKKLDVEAIPLYERGALKERIKQVVQDLYRSATYESVAKQELAGWLGERPDANVEYLESRVRGFVRFATRNRDCPCGHNVNNVVCGFPQRQTTATP